MNVLAVLLVATQITGPAPHILGASMQTVLRADQRLRPARVWCDARIPSLSYGRTLTVPLAGQPHNAELTVNFWGKKVGCVILKWKIPGRSAWEDATLDLYWTIYGNYDRSLIEKEGSPSSSGAVLILNDSKGNRLAFVSDPFTLTVIYTWAPFAAQYEKLRSVPTPRF